MAIPATNKGGSSKHSTAADPKKPPANEPKKPKDNTAAKQSPDETKAAVNNAFGSAPTSGNAKQPAPADQPKNAAPPADGKASADPKAPADDKAPSGLGTALNNDPKAPAGNPGDPVKDAQGQPVKTPDGRNVVLDENKNPIPVDDDGKAIQDGSGNPYMVLPDGKYAVTDTGNPVVYDKANANKPVAIDPQTGNAIKDPGGNILAVGKDGNFIKTPDGDTVVYNKNGNKYNLMATGKDGNPLVINGYPAAVDETGKYRQTPNQDPIVYDKQGNPVALDKDGKVVADQNGKALAVDENGNYILDKNGYAAIYDPRGVPVQYAGTSPETNTDVFEDVKTGEKVGVVNDYVYKIDPATGDIAKDADGNILPPIYDPVNSDPTRPPVRPNDNIETTLKNLPQGKERGDPMTIKDELFDEHGNLDVNKIHEAAAKYDPRDIYDALINSSVHGGWDNIPQPYYESTIAHPNEDQSRQVIATLIAWQNENGKYNPYKQGKMPAIVFTKGGPGGMPGYALTTNDAIYIDMNTNRIPSVLFHELNHTASAETFEKAYDGKENFGQLEVITEFLSNNWTGNGSDTGYETHDYPLGFKSLEVAVEKMGNGDRDKGLDILKRAYFGGDLAALEVLKKHFPPGQDLEHPKYNEYEPGQPSTQA